MPVAAVIVVVVSLLVLAALCGTIAIWTILNDLKAAGTRPPDLEVPAIPVATPPPPFWPRPAPRLQFRPSLPFDLRQTLLYAPPVRYPRLAVPPGVPMLPAPWPRSRILGTRDDHEDQSEEHDYTEVDDGVTVIRDSRHATRR